ncbi:MAG: hypothetical protein EOL86_02875 [Deltaproteobacteria bacterium]|nr:hypothetical protein [Deltaproteobacteria bacterium]
MTNKLFQPVVNGFKVLASETKWVFIKGVRRWEIRQMKKRLSEEYQNLGKSYAEAQAKGGLFDPHSSDNDLTLKQIVFLREEITHLEQDLVNTRAEFVAKRNRDAKSED